MAHGADFSVNLLGRTIGFERVPAAAVDRYFTIFWMYVFFHMYFTPYASKPHILTSLPGISTEIFDN